MSDAEALTVLRSIAGILGCPDPFSATPRDVYARMRRIVDEHSVMRAQLERLVDELDTASGLVRAVRWAP